MTEENSPLPDRLVFFDGICAFCNRSVRFILKRDKRERFFFAPLQGSTAEKILPGQNPEQPESLCYLRKGILYRKSSAALHIALDLDGAWFLLAPFLLIPAPFRDYLYDGFAARRYAWFGKYDSCQLPDAGERARYLP